MEEEAQRRVPWRVISAILASAVVILAAISAFQFLTRAEEFVPTCPTNYQWDAPTRSCILSDTLAPTGVSAVSRGLASVGEVLTFDGSDSTDNVAITEWRWAFGDGTEGTGKTVLKAFYVPGDYIVSLVVRDAAGNEGTNEASLTRVRVVGPGAPEANETAPVALLAVDRDVIERGQAVFADGNGSWQWNWSVADAAFSKEIGADNLMGVDYDFGDGSTGAGANLSHTYAKSGTYALRLAVTAWNGLKSFSIHTVHVLTEPADFVGEVKNPDTFIDTSISEGEHMDPGRSYDTSSDAVLRMVYDPLIAWDRDSLTDMIPMLADKVPVAGDGISADGLNYTFTIRQGVNFHMAPYTLSPADVEYTFERNMISDFAGGPMWLLLEPLTGAAEIDAAALSDAELTAIVDTVRDSVEVVGQDVIFHLAFPFPPFLSVLAGGGWGLIMDKEYLIGEKNQWPMTYDLATIREYNRKHDTYALHGDKPGDVMGTGPFTFKSWDVDVQIVLERWDGYWRTPASYEFLVLKNVPEWGTRKLMLLNGDTDLAFVPTAFREQVLGAPGLRLISGLPTLTITYVGFNVDIVNTPPNPAIGSGLLDGDGIPPDFFADQRIRRAFSWAFDYDTYTQDVFKGLSEQPFGPVPRPFLGYTDQGPKYSLDLAKAEAEFKASSFMPDLWNLGFKYTAFYNEGNDQRRIAQEILKDNLAAINPKFVVDIQPVPWGEYLGAMIDGTTTAAAIGWRADYADPHNFVHPFMRSGAGAFANWFSYQNVTVDGWIDDAARELDPSVREQIYFDIQKANFWDPPGIWLAQPQVDHFERTWVQGWYFNPVTTPYYYDYGKG
ncbi:MAG: ABC transporter substrate-binding protein [Thermoplasmata archaeon]